MLIGYAGNLWPMPRDAILQRYGPLRRVRRPVAAAVERGFVSVNFHDARASVALVPGLATAAALDRLSHLILSHNPARALLCSDAGLSKWELVLGASRLVGRIQELVNAARFPAPRILRFEGRFSLDSLDKVGDGRMAGAFAAWDTSGEEPTSTSTAIC